jgi:hypothetical protein
MTRSERDAILVGIRISARIWELRWTATRIAEVFAAARRAGYSNAEAETKMSQILDEQAASER